MVGTLESDDKSIPDQFKSMPSAEFWDLASKAKQVKKVEDVKMDDDSEVDEHWEDPPDAEVVSSSDGKEELLEVFSKDEWVAHKQSIRDQSL